MMRTIFLSVMAAIFIGTATLVPAWAEEIHFRDADEGWTAEHKRFLETLSEVFKRENPAMAPNWDPERVHTALADLNGDGVREFLIYPASAVMCGNTGDCDVSVYQKQESGWVYIGSVFQTEGTITVEDHWVNGWRTLSNKKSRYHGAYRHCWVPSTDPEEPWMTEDQMGMPSTPGMAGYFGSSPIDEECPEVTALAQSPTD